MRTLLALFRKVQVFLFFLVLEGISLSLIFQQNHYQNAVFYNSASGYVGRILDWQHSVQAYFDLREHNERLAEENKRLRTELALNQQLVSRRYSEITLDSSLVKKYEFLVAKVINNSTHRSDNYLTLNKGLKQGVKPGMGVVSSQGVVGIVKSCSENYSTVISLLHSGMKISAVLNKNQENGRIEWDGKSYRSAKLLEISNHLPLKRGDTVSTSGYGRTFPPGTMIGTIKSFDTGAQTYYDIEVNLSTPFNKLNFVYLIKNRLAPEQKALEVDSLVIQP